VPEPQFFVDRSLGRVRVPQLMRADGWSLVTLAEHYGIPADCFIRHRERIWTEAAGDGHALFAATRASMRWVDVSD
jgi:hypothetical protein